jgi:hypothetical protein
VGQKGGFMLDELINIIVNIALLLSIVIGEYLGYLG